MQNVVDSRSGQHVCNRYYTPRSEYFVLEAFGVLRSFHDLSHKVRHDFQFRFSFA
jgi:hypothetical protein